MSEVLDFEISRTTLQMRGLMHASVSSGAGSTPVLHTEIPKAGKSWYKNSTLGVNSLRSMMKNMVMINASSQLQATQRKLVKHSTRKHLGQKLVNNNVPPTEIAQSTGHKKRQVD